MTSTSALDALRAQVRAARAASPALAVATSAEKNAAIAAIAAGLRDRRDEVAAANARDIAKAGADGVTPAVVDRIRLDADRVDRLAGSLAAVVALPDPVGETIESELRPNGLEIGRVRVPLGVIAVIYENRPNVTIDIAALCLKSGNACVLRGGREAIESNRVLAAIIAAGLTAAGLPGDAVQFVANTDRALVGALLGMNDLIDLMIPRGGKGLVERVRDEASMPVVAGGIGICHTYVDRAADLAMALDIVDNAKTRRVSICNALDVMILHSDVAAPFLARWPGAGGIAWSCAPTPPPPRCWPARPRAPAPPARTTSTRSSWTWWRGSGWWTRPRRRWRTSRRTARATRKRS